MAQIWRMKAQVGGGIIRAIGAIRGQNSEFSNDRRRGTTETQRHGENGGMNFLSSLCLCAFVVNSGFLRLRPRDEIGLRDLASIDSTFIPARGLLSAAARRNRAADFRKLATVGTECVRLIPIAVRNWILSGCRLSAGRGSAASAGPTVQKRSDVGLRWQSQTDRAGAARRRV